MRLSLFLLNEHDDDDDDDNLWPRSRPQGPCHDVDLIPLIRYCKCYTVAEEFIVVSGQLAEAADSFELCYSLTKGRTDWLTADGETSMHSLSCSNLTRIYTTIANHYSKQNDQELSLQYLVRAYEKSKEGQ